MPITVNIYNNTGEGFKTENPYINAVNNIKNGQNTIRKDNCSTPFRMPLFGSRKQTNCDNCEENTKVLVDNHALYCCYDPYITSKQNKGGIIKNDFMYSHAFYLNNRNKSYEKNIVSGSSEKIENEDYNYVNTPEDTREILVYTVTNIIEDGRGKYQINGKNNARLQLYRNKRYVFVIDSVGHPFWIKTVSSTNDLNGLTEGITNNGIEQGEITLTITNNNFHHLYYNCQYHSSMAGMIDIYNENNDYVKCNKTTFKKRNFSHNQMGAVSHRSRINRLKYNAVHARKVANYGSTCSNRNRNCYDDNKPKHLVDIAKPLKCTPKTLHDKLRRRNKKITCDPNYTGEEEDTTPTINYVFPKFQPQRQPPPENGLPSTFYHNNYIGSFSLYNFDYNHLEFNTSFNNRNPSFIPGPVATEDETTNNPSELFTFDVSDNQITYVTQTPDVTTVVTTNVDTGVSETDVYLTSTVRNEELVTGEPVIVIGEIKVMNKTVKVVVEFQNVSYWTYSINNGPHIDVLSGYAAIFNVENYETYNLSVKGVDIQGRTLLETLSTFTTVEPLGIVYQPINQSTGTTTETTTETSSDSTYDNTTTGTTTNTNTNSDTNSDTNTNTNTGGGYGY